MDKPKISFQSRVNPLVANLPKHLKNPANFEDIQRRIYKTLETKCSHSDLLEFSKCSSCTSMMLKRRKLMRELGFKNAGQYLEWRKIHEKIKATMPLVDWKRKSIIT